MSFRTRVPSMLMVSMLACGGPSAAMPGIVAGQRGVETVAEQPTPAANAIAPPTATATVPAGAADQPGGSSAAGLPLAAPGETPPVPTSRPPTWQFWFENRAEDDPADVDPEANWVRSLKRDRSYHFVVQLATSAPAPFMAQSADGAFLTLGPELRSLLDDLSKADEPDDVMLQVYVVADSVYFAEGGTAGATLRVDVRKYKLWRAEGSPQPGVVLGDARLHLRTGPRATPTASLAALIWKGSAPLDEYLVSVCIAGDGAACPAAPPRVLPLGDRPDPLRPASSDIPQPTASLQLVEIGAGEAARMFGIFREQGRPAIGWDLRISGTRLRDEVAGTIGRALEASMSAQSELGLRDRGVDLLNLLFPWDYYNPAAFAANKAFLDFVRRHRDDTPPAMLFVRVVTSSVAAPILPVALIASPAASPGARPEPIGLTLRVESALPRQSYRATACPQRWRVLLPASQDYSDGNALHDAATASGLLPGTVPWSSPDFEVKSDFEAFRSWMREPQASDPPTVLVIVSHHAQNRIWFDRGTEMTHLSFVRTLGEPSVAIVNGCGTGETTSAQVVHTLNQRGADVTIATSTTVLGQMAGDYIACLVDQVKSTPAEGRPVSDLHFAALRCLSSKVGPKGSAYGARALTFTLMGNGAIHLCKPGGTP